VIPLMHSKIVNQDAKSNGGQDLQMKGINIKGLPQSMLEGIEYYFRTKHLPVANNSSGKNGEELHLNDDKFIKLSLMQKLKTAGLVKNPNEDADGDYYFTPLDDYFHNNPTINDVDTATIKTVNVSRL